MTNYREVSYEESGVDALAASPRSCSREEEFALGSSNGRARGEKMIVIASPAKLGTAPETEIAALAGAPSQRLASFFPAG